jgi:hypothetical protein
VDDERISDQLEHWIDGDGPHTVDALIDLFGPKSFAVLFVILLGVPALPLPTGGATHVMEVIAVLLAAQLVLGRDDVWLPKRWRRLELAGSRQQKFLRGLLKLIRRLERMSKPRGRWLFEHGASNAVFGLLVIGGTVAAFFAPPFSGLDTLPSLGVVLLSLGVLMEDVAIALAGIVVVLIGAALEIVLGKAAVDAVKSLL